MYIIFYNTYMLLIVLHLVYIFSTESFTILYRIYYYYYIITTLLYIYPKYYTRFIILLIIFSQRRSHEQINDRVMLGARRYSKSHHYGSFQSERYLFKIFKNKNSGSPSLESDGSLYHIRHPFLSWKGCCYICWKWSCRVVCSHSFIL